MPDYQLLNMLHAAGYAAAHSGPGTIYVRTPHGHTYISTTSRNGGRGYWQGTKDGKRVIRKTIPGTLGRGWRDRLVAWLKKNARTAKRYNPW